MDDIEEHLRDENLIVFLKEVATCVSIIILKRFVDQCDMCRKMFVRDSPAPTVGQKLVGGDCQVRSDVVHFFGYFFS